MKHIFKMLGLIAVFALSFMGYTTYNTIKLENKKQAVEMVRQAEIKQQNNIYFSQNKESIIAKANNDLLKNKYQQVVTQLSKYIDFGSVKANDIYHKANAELETIVKENKTKSIVGKLKTIQKKDYKQKLSLYRTLVKLTPNNEEYKNQVKFYSTKIMIRDRHAKKTKTRKQQIKKQFNRDGSNDVLANFIKENMNDPSTYQHVSTEHADMDGYVYVATTYRGTNAFGALVINNITAKMSYKGRIIKILSQE